MTNTERIERLEARIRWLELVIERGFENRDSRLRIVEAKVERMKK